MPEIEYLKTILISITIVVFLIFIIRLIGLRSFSKMTGFDFAITISVGTLIASPIINSKVSLSKGLVAVTAMLVIQFLISFLRHHFDSFSSMIDNKPLLLFSEGKFLEENLASSRVKKGDVVAKMREANATDLSKIAAVVLESTGDISVLHGNKVVDSIMLDGVRT